MQRIKIAAAGLLSLSLVAGSAAFADSNGAATNDAAESQAFAAAKINLADAAMKAEVTSGGKVMSIDFNAGDKTEAAAYDVEILMADGTIADYQVDPTDGTVKLAVETADDQSAGDGENAGGGENGGENGSENGEGN